MKLSLPVQIVLGIVGGIIFGLVAKDYVMWVAPLGDIFIRLLKMIIVPLVLASIIMGVVSLGDIQHLKNIGVKSLFLFVVTTVLAVAIGIVSASFIQPGLGANLVAESASDFAEKAPPSIVQLLVEIVPKNMVSALAEAQMLSIIFFAVLIGCAFMALGKKADPLVQVVSALDQSMMKLAQWIMVIAPIGVFALMAKIVADTGVAAFIPLAKYVATAVIGLIIHAVVVLPMLIFFFGKYNPLTLATKMFTALATAFSTSSSAATLPITMDRLTKRVGISQKVTGFVIPLGTTINMDGTALYQAVATLFIAQVYGIDLTMTHFIIITLTATLASIGAAAIPSAGLITMIMILNAVNVPVGGIGLILAVDRIIDMCRTTVNVWSNVTVSFLVSRMEKETLQPTE